MSRIETAKNWVKVHRLTLVMLGATAMTAAVSAEVNLSGISDVITAIVDIVPDLLDLIVGIVPIIVTIALVGFLVKFFDKILGMLNL